MPASLLSGLTDIFFEKRSPLVIAAGFLDTFTCQPYFEGGKDETPS